MKKAVTFLALALGATSLSVAHAQGLPFGTPQLTPMEDDAANSPDGSERAVAVTTYRNGATTSQLYICQPAASQNCNKAGQAYGPYPGPYTLENPNRMGNVAWSAGGSRVYFTQNQDTPDPRVVSFNLKSGKYLLGDKPEDGIQARKYQIVPSGRFKGDMILTLADGSQSVVDPSNGQTLVAAQPADQVAAKTGVKNAPAQLAATTGPR